MIVVCSELHILMQHEPNKLIIAPSFLCPVKDAGCSLVIPDTSNKKVNDVFNWLRHLTLGL